MAHTKTYEEIVGLLGGEQRVDDIPAFIPGQMVAAAIKFLKDATHIRWPYLPHDTCLATPVIRATLVRMTGLFANVEQDAAGTQVISIPVGLLARTWVLARLLFTFWEDDSPKTMFMNSPLDDIDPHEVFLPPTYRPIFGDFVDPDEYWQALRELNSRIPVDHGFDANASAVALHILCFVIFHELQHVYFRHDEILKALHLAGRGAEADDIFRGFELQADYYASCHAVQVLFDAVEQAAPGNDEECWNLFIRLGFGVTMLLGLMDCLRKYVHCFRVGVYAHPIVRYHVFAQAARHSVDFLERPNVSKMWHDAELESWRRCLDAYSRLSWRMMIDHQSETPVGQIMQPVQAMMYGGFAGATFLNQLTEREMAIMENATKLNHQYLKTRRL